MNSWQLMTITLLLALVLVGVLWTRSLKREAVLSAKVDSTQRVIDRAVDAAEDRCQIRVESLITTYEARLNKCQKDIDLCETRNQIYDDLRSNTNRLVDTYRRLLIGDIDPPDD